MDTSRPSDRSTSSGDPRARPADAADALADPRSGAPLDARLVARATEVVRAGGVLAYPTEAVFGLGCDPARADAVARVLALKGRDAAKGFIVVAARLDELADWIDTDLDVALAQEARRPAFATWCWPMRARCPDWLRGAHPTLAVRIPAWPPLRQLLAATGPLLSTSANRSGGAACRDADCVRRVFGDRLDLIMDAPTGGAAAPSPVRVVATGERLR